jgi:S-adenosylmethionine synthetase
MGVDRSNPRNRVPATRGYVRYASNETDALMPAPICFAHRLVERQAEVRKSKLLSWLRPDAKSQVTCRYRNGKVADLHRLR